MAIGSIGAVGTGNGEFTVTGSLETYFGDKTIYRQDHQQHADLVRHARRPHRRQPRVAAVRFSLDQAVGGSPAVSGKNADVMIQAGFQAIMDATLGYTMSVGRFWYLPIV
jgi:hypothetical protein